MKGETDKILLLLFGWDIRVRVYSRDLFTGPLALLSVSRPSDSSKRGDLTHHTPSSTTYYRPESLDGGRSRKGKVPIDSTLTSSPPRTTIPGTVGRGRYGDSDPQGRDFASYLFVHLGVLLWRIIKSKDLWNVWWDHPTKS